MASSDLDLSLSFLSWEPRVDNGWTSLRSPDTFASARDLFVEAQAIGNRSFHKDDISLSVHEFLARWQCLADWYGCLFKVGGFEIEFLDGRPRVVLNGLSTWRRITSRVDPDALISLRLATLEIDGKLNALDALSSLRDWGVFIGATDDRLNRILSKGLTDTHVHFEASDPLPLLWLRLLHRHCKIGSVPRYASDKVHALRGDAVRHRGRLNEIQRIKDSRRQRQRLSLGFGIRYPSDRHPRELDLLYAERDFLVRAWLHLLRNRSDQVFARSFDTYLFGKNRFLATHQQFPGSNPGLTTFREYLDRGRSLTEGKQRSRSNKASLRRLLAMADFASEPRNLRGLELRIAPKSNVAEYKKLFRFWERAVRPKLRRTRSEIDIGFIIHFIRRPDDALRSGDRFSYEHLRRRLDKQSAALQAFRRQCPDLARHIVGLDVANLERGCPPEIFAPFLLRLRDDDRLFSGAERDDHVWRPEHWSRLAERGLDRHAVDLPRLGLTYHAGEDFYHPLDGMRNMDKLCKNVLRPGDRIGHGLAAAWDIATFHNVRGREVAIPQGNLLDDLVWLREEMRQLGGLEDPLSHEVDRMIDLLCEKIYGHVARTSQLEELLDLRFRLPPIQPGTNSGSAISLHAAEVLRTDVRRARRTVAKLSHSELLFHLSASAIKAQSKLIDSLRQKGITVEANPSSNLATGAVSDLTLHPLFRYQEIIDGRPLGESRRIGKPITTLNTDDPGVFATTLEIEFGLVLEAMIRNGIDREAAFTYLDEIRRLGKESSFLWRRKKFAAVSGGSMSNIGNGEELVD